VGEVDELFRQMKKALLERVLAGELTHHLGTRPAKRSPVTSRITATGRRRKRC
jgi:transposase-like protein